MEIMFSITISLTLVTGMLLLFTSLLLSNVSNWHYQLLGFLVFITLIAITITGLVWVWAFDMCCIAL